MILSLTVWAIILIGMILPIRIFTRARLYDLILAAINGRDGTVCSVGQAIENKGEDLQVMSSAVLQYVVAVVVVVQPSWVCIDMFNYVTECDLLHLSAGF